MKHNWIKLELELIAKENLIEFLDLPKDLIMQSSLYLKLEKSKEIIKLENFANFLAYLYQSRKAMAKLRENLAYSNLDKKIRLAESIGLIEDMLFMETLDEFATNNNILAQGSMTLELGLNVTKNFQEIRQYLILKIYLDRIYRAILDFLEKNSEYKIMRELVSDLRYSKVYEEISTNIFGNFLLKEKLDSNKILEAAIGSELLISSFKLSDHHMREAYFSMIKDKFDNTFLNYFYEYIDKNISENLKNLGLDEREIQKIISKFMFLERRLC